MPIIIIPVLSSLIVGLAFVFLIGAPVAQVFESLTVWLAGIARIQLDPSGIDFGRHDFI
ncbi:hypothetical protein P7F88_10990 [Vibrio hannami]|nr:hypothetical protein [Vibrio hannami]MDG3086609.1 hypothetical protein [Vibrio hannami]